MIVRIPLEVSPTGLPALFGESFNYLRIFLKNVQTELLEVLVKVIILIVIPCGRFSLIVTIVQVIDAVTTACSQICIHLSEPLYDLVLNMVFDYASTNVRTNAVRAIHQLVECVANADPVKTLAKFLPFCSKNIRTELENGASSLRTTSSSTPIPSDATLHWSLWNYFIFSCILMTIYRSGHLERSGL